MASSRPATSTLQGSAEHQRQQLVQREVTRAQEDYQRLRSAYLETAQTGDGHDVALAMLGADMNRAHARLQSLSGSRPLPVVEHPGSVGVDRHAVGLGSE